MKLLVIEDDDDVRELVRILLREEGHVVDTAATATDGGLLAHVNEYDGIVLDVRLPDGNGLALARQLRGERRATPILLLTAQTGTQEVVRGLDAGADDYVVKPFAPEELKARLRALLRRTSPAPQDQLACGALVLNRLSHQALLDGRPLALTAKEFAVLEHFVLHAEQVVTRTQLLERVWDRVRDPDSNVIDVHVARLRAKLRPANGRPRLTTVRGVGFRLTADAAGDSAG
ncbi:MAG TPA: response regulator transcription factor [Gemmatimonadaceae bacterium]|nr:response regulator transcription factor [Gemmatimonadaceae bacterium]